MNPNSLALAVSRGCAQTFRRPRLLLPSAPLQVSILSKLYHKLRY